jgi:phage terminase large subunit GpA-like protein
MVTMLNNAEVVYKESFRLGLALDPKHTIDEWADEHMILSSDGSAEPGRYRTSRVPFMKEIMICLSPSHPCNRVVLMKPSQISGTQLIINWAGYCIDLCPCPFLIVEPTVDLAKTLSKQRLAPAIRDTPVLNKKITPAREKDSGNTVLSKEYPGGIVLLRGANSAAGLRMMPVRNLALDEVDAYPLDVEGEGDPVSLAEKRTVTFGSRRKVFIPSSPTEKGASLVEREYDQSDQRRYNVPCPHCGTKQVLSWKGIKFERDERYNLISAVTYICHACGTHIEERHKTEMLAKGEWIAENQEDGQCPGFHINALYAPIGWFSWADIVKDFLKFKKLKSETLQKTWTNTILAETWESQGKEVEYTGLFNRREEFPTQINSDIVIITASVDVQDDRLEVKTVGWATFEESFVLETKFLIGSPGLPTVWNNLDEFIRKTYVHECGLMRIVCTAVDTGGHHTKEVYDFVKEREHLNVYAIKGASLPGQPISGKPSKQKNGVNLYMIGTDTAKDLLFHRLTISEPGPGYIHFPTTLTEEYFKQLTAEKKRTKYVKGFKKFEWVKTRDRNEALDLFVYNIAALNIVAFIVYPNLTIVQMLDGLAEQHRKMSEPEVANTSVGAGMINEGERIE